MDGSTTKTCPCTSWSNTKRGRTIKCSKKMNVCGLLCYSTCYNTYGMHQTKNKKFLVSQQGLQGAEFRSLGHMECLRLRKKIPGIPAGVAGGRIQVLGPYGMHQTKNKKFLVSQQGLQGADFRSLGHMECIRPKTKFLVYQQGLQGAEFGSLGHMECIRLRTKNCTHPVRTPRSAKNVVPHS